MIALDTGDKIRCDAAAAVEVDYLIFGFIGTVATQIADGQLPAAIGDLYTAGADGIGISSIVLVNAGAVARVVNLYLTPNAGAARRLTPKDYSLGVGRSLLTDGKSIHNFPSGAATAANQDTIITALESLTEALESVATDRLLVRGMDQLHSFKAVLHETQTGAISGAGGWFLSDPCAAGEIWHVTNVLTFDLTSATTAIWIDQMQNGASFTFDYQAAAHAAVVPWVWKGDVWLDPGDTIRGIFIGSQAGDTITMIITGEIMTLET